MKSKPLVLCALLAAALVGEVAAHGGAFPPPVGPPVPGGSGGPGPTHPPPSGPTGGSNPGPGDTVPSGPSGGPPGPTTGGGSGGPSTPPAPSTPAKPTGPATGGPGAPSTPPPPRRSPGAPSTGAMTDTGDPTAWESWWFYNQDRYLELKSHVTALEVRTGTEAEFLGNGRAVAMADAGAVTQRVIPALMSLLENERQQDVVTGSLIALARLADGPIATRASELGHAFAVFTDDPNQEISETSVVARGIVGDESSASELADLLENGEAIRARHGGHEVTPRTRAFAAFSLGLLGAHSKNEDLRRFVVHHLVRTLREDRGALPDVQVACVTALGLTPLPWSKNEDDGVHSPATPAAARRNTGVASASRETELECLLAVLADTAGDRWVRAHVPTALSRLSAGAGEAARAEIAGALLEHITPREKDEVVQGCVLALGALGDADRDEIDVKVRAMLEGVVVGADQLSRRLALISLAQGAARRGQSGTSEATDEVRQFLAKRLAEGRSHERCWAAIALGVLEHDLAHQSGTEPGPNAPALKRDIAAANIRAQVLAGLRDAGSGTEVGALAIAAGLMRDPSATPVLLSKLERTAEASTQGYIAVGLGLVGDATASPALRAQLATARFKPDLLRDTAIGLALLEDPTLVLSLVETLEKASSLASQSAAASVLGWIGDRRTIDPLLALVARRDATMTARAFAAVALGRVCDQDRMPWNAAVSADVHYRAATATLTSGDGTGLLDML